MTTIPKSKGGHFETLKEMNRRHAREFKQEASATTTECADDCHFGDHDAPAAPERGEWRYVETRYSAEVAVNDNLQLRAHWTGTWDRDEIRTLMQGVVTEHNQHSTLIAQRERLLDLLKQTRAFICEATWTETKPRKREAEGLVTQIDAVITTSEQEGRTEQ